MADRLNREELELAVRKLLDSEGTEEELGHLLQTVQSSVPHPDMSDLIYHTQVPLSAEEIVEVALSYKSLALPKSDRND